MLKKKRTGKQEGMQTFSTQSNVPSKGMDNNIIIFQFCHQMLINIEAMGALFFIFFIFFFFVVWGAALAGRKKNKMKQIKWRY